MDKSNMYSRGKIYKIVSPSHPELVYYGSTVNELYKRLCQHKTTSKNTTSCKLIICYDDAKIVLVENFACNDRNELQSKEYEYISNNECVNKLGRGLDKDRLKDRMKNYYVENKDLIAEKCKNYRNENKEQIKERRQQTITCECGKTIQKKNLANHRKSTFHLKNIPHADTSIEV